MASKQWVMGLVLLGVVGAGIGYRQLKPSGPPPPPPPLSETWKITSVRTGEDPANPADQRNLAPGDKLLAFGPASAASCYGFLQDRVKFEVSYSEAQELNNEGMAQDVVGIQLGGGRGEVRMIVMCAPAPLDNLTPTLQGMNLYRLAGDEALKIMAATVQKRPGMSNLRVLASHWYTLDPTTPPVNGVPEGAAIPGAPALPAAAPATPAGAAATASPASGAAATPPPATAAPAQPASGTR